MDIEELETQLTEEVENYLLHIEQETDYFKSLPERVDKEKQLFNMVEELHRRNFSALLGMKENIIKYLKEQGEK